MGILRSASVLLVAAALAAADPWADADLILRIPDGRTLEREALRFAGARGDDAGEVRAAVARMFWQSHQLDGIDGTRTGVFAWRSGRPGLRAAIPAADRDALIDHFGAVPPGEAPIVRTGDRDGSVVYTQNRRDGTLREMRLLISEGVACVGASLDESRAIAASGEGTVPPAAGAPAASVAVRGQALRDGHPWLQSLAALLPAVPIDATRPAIRGGHLLAAPGAWLADLRGQLRLVQGELRFDPTGAAARFTATAEVAADTPLATWLAAQRPALSRLAPALRSDATAALLVVQSGFQGQWERALLAAADQFRTASGAAWSAPAESAFRSGAGLQDRSGSIAVAWDVGADGGVTEVWATEHPRALELGAFNAQVAAALARGAAADSAIAGRPAWRLPGAAGWIAAADRHLVAASGPRAEARAGGLPQALGRSVPPEGEPALVWGFVDLAKLWAHDLPEDGLRSEPVVIGFAVRQAGPNRIQATVTVPHQALGTLLGRLRKK